MLSRWRKEAQKKKDRVRKEFWEGIPKRAEILAVLSHNLSDSAILWLSWGSDGKTGGKDAAAKQLPCRPSLSTVADYPVPPKQFSCRTQANLL